MTSIHNRCIWCCSLWQTVVLPHRDRKIPISVLTQSSVESADCCGKCEWAFSNLFNNVSLNSLCSANNVCHQFLVHPPWVPLKDRSATRPIKTVKFWVKILFSNENSTIIFAIKTKFPLKAGIMLPLLIGNIEMNAFSRIFLTFQFTK